MIVMLPVSQYSGDQQSENISNGSHTQLCMQSPAPVEKVSYRTAAVTMAGSRELPTESWEWRVGHAVGSVESRPRQYSGFLFVQV